MRFVCITALAALAMPVSAELNHPVMPIAQVAPPALSQPRLDVTRIAVHATLDEPAMEMLLNDALGVGPAAIEQIAVADWYFIDVPGVDQTTGGVEEMLATLAARDGIMIAAPVLLSNEGSPGMPTSTLLVRFHDDLLPQQANAVLTGRGLQPVTELPWTTFPGIYKVTCDSRNGLEIMRAASELSEHPAVRHAEVDMLFQGRSGGFGYPDDPDFEFCWALHNDGTYGTADADMDVLEAWATTTGDSSIEVLIIDTGVQQDHPDINQNPGIDFTSSSGGDGGPGNGCDKHGTPVAGCVSAILNNGLLIAGAAPECKSVSARCFISEWVFCSGGWWSQYSHTVSALDYAVVNDIEITNNSNLYGGWRSPTIDVAYAESREAGVVHFACAGNTGDWFFGYPASLPSVVSVSAFNQYDALASWSSYCPGVTLCAPGQWILATDRTGEDGYTDEDYAYVDGTSFSSPYTAAVAALVLSERPELSPQEVENILKASAVDYGDPGPDLLYGWGVVNANNALQEVLTPQTLDVCPSGCTYSSLQDAINAASNGDTITVGPGVYTGAPLTPAVMQTYGKQLTIQSTNGAEETIIDGQGVRRGLLCDHGEPIDTVIDGFTFRNGQAVDYDFGDGVAWNLGGGILCASASSPSISNCVIENSNAEYAGGIYGYQAHFSLDNCIIRGNSAEEYGGGMAFSEESRSMITSCTFTENTAGIAGGALAFWNGDDVIFNNCVFADNSALIGGGVAYIQESSAPIFNDCQFDLNTSGSYGGAFYVTFARVEVFGGEFTGNSAANGGMVWTEASNITVEGITAIDNVATSGDGGVICLTTNSGGTLTNSTLSDNTSGRFGGGVSLDSSNLHIEDSTISSNTAVGDGGGAHVLTGSLTVRNSVFCGNAPTQIAANNWGDQGGNTIEDECETCTGDLDGDGAVGIQDLLELLNYWEEPGGDLDGDGNTNIKDLLILIGFWGECE
ncbi:MAG: S8 family serine peptidase [Phycisphaerales bacterium]|nr:S8 family serine peptidase [Phycisphaerales bacterium]